MNITKLLNTVQSPFIFNIDLYNNRFTLSWDNYWKNISQMSLFFILYKNYASNGKSSFNNLLSPEHQINVDYLFPFLDTGLGPHLLKRKQNTSINKSKFRTCIIYSMLFNYTVYELYTDPLFTLGPLRLIHKL